MEITKTSKDYNQIKAKIFNQEFFDAESSFDSMTSFKNKTNEDFESISYQQKENSRIFRLKSISLENIPTHYTEHHDSKEINLSLTNLEKKSSVMGFFQELKKFFCHNN